MPSCAPSRRPTGSTLTARLSIDDEPVDADEVRPIGHIGDLPLRRCAATGSNSRSHRVPLPAPVHALVTARAAITVPAEDTDEFLTQHLPRLLRQVAVDAPGIDLPAAERPVLVVTARFSPAHRLDFALALALRRPRAGAVSALRCPTIATARPKTRSARGSKRSGEDAAPVAFAAAGQLSGIDAAEFASRLLPALEALPDVAVEIHGERPRYRELTADPHVTVSTVETTDPDWFDLGVIVTIDGRTIPFAPLFTALTQGPPQAAAQRRALLLALASRRCSACATSSRRRASSRSGRPVRASAATRPRSGPTSKTSPTSPSPPSAGGATAEALRDLDRIPPTPLPAGLHAQLRPYQRTGFDWLAFLWQHRLGGILADDMGLGKTIQMLALIAHTRESRRDAAVPRRGTDVRAVHLANRGRAVHPGSAGGGRGRHAREAGDLGDGCRGIR